MALKDSVRQQISTAAQKDPAYWSGVFDKAKEERIEEYLGKNPLPFVEANRNSLRGSHWASF